MENQLENLTVEMETSIQGLGFRSLNRETMKTEMDKTVQRGKENGKWNIICKLGFARVSSKGFGTLVEIITSAKY